MIKKIQEKHKFLMFAFLFFLYLWIQNFYYFNGQPFYYHFDEWKMLGIPDKTDYIKRLFFYLSMPICFTLSYASFEKNIDIKKNKILFYSLFFLNLLISIFLQFLLLIAVYILAFLLFGKKFSSRTSILAISNLLYFLLLFLTYANTLCFIMLWSVPTVLYVFFVEKNWVYILKVYFMSFFIFLSLTSALYHLKNHDIIKNSYHVNMWGEPETERNKKSSLIKK